MTFDTIVKLIKDLIVTLGGASVLIIAATKFLKKRFEKYFDTQIQLKSDEALKLFESNLEKKKVYYEKKVAKEMESIDAVVEFYTKSFPFVDIMKKTISGMIIDDLPTSSIASLRESVISLQGLVQNAKQNRVILEIYLDKQIYLSYSKLLTDLEKCISLYNLGINTYDLDTENRNELSTTIEAIYADLETGIRELKSSILKKTK